MLAGMVRQLHCDDDRGIRFVIPHFCTEDGMTVTDFRPRMVLVYGDSLFASKCSRDFRRQGWAVHMAADVDEACRLADELTPLVVVVDGASSQADAQTCGRIVQRCPGQATVLLTVDGAHQPALEPIRISRRDHVNEALNEVLSRAAQ
jgi:ActR/RegA family two-component response regulator